MLFSIVIPLYNNAKKISETIDSIQSDPDLADICYEVVVINDCSIDRSYHAALYSLINSSISNFTLLSNSINLGISASLNKGLSYCRGKYVFRLDSDDLWVNGRSKASINLLSSMSSEDVIVGTHMIGTSGRYYNSNSIISSIFPLIFTSPCFHPSWCTSLKLLKTIGYKVSSPFDDYYLLLEHLSKGGKIINIPYPYVIYNDSYSAQRLTLRNLSRRDLLTFLVRPLILCLFIQNYILPSTSNRFLLSFIRTILSIKFHPLLLRFLYPLTFITHCVNYLFFRLHLLLIVSTFYNISIDLIKF